MKKKILLTLLSLVVILALAAPSCIPKKAETGQNPTDTERVAALESTVSQLQSKVASLPAPKDYGDEVVGLINQQMALEAEIAALEGRIAVLEVQEEEEAAENEESDNVTRWYYDLMWWSDSSKVDVTVDYVSPSRIDEAGDYRIHLKATNYDPDKAVNDLVVDLTFTPKSGSRVYIDEDNTYLDTTNVPYTLWDVDVVERGDDKYCRRITCRSEPIYLDPATMGGTTEEPVVVPYTWTFKLEFSLEYE